MIKNNAHRAIPYIIIYGILSQNIAHAEKFTCHILRESSGQLRNAGETGLPKTDVLNGLYSFEFQKEKKVVKVSLIEGSDNIPTGEFSYEENDNFYHFCMHDTCDLQRKTMTDKEATIKFEKLKFFKNINIITQNWWYYVDFYNHPYNDSFAISSNIIGNCA